MELDGFAAEELGSNVDCELLWVAANQYRETVNCELHIYANL